MPDCLQTGVERSHNNAYSLEPGSSDEAVWNKLSGEAWDACVDDATSNGGEPGVFQEAIWYMNEADNSTFAKSQEQQKEELEQVVKDIQEAASAASNAGFSEFRTPGAGIVDVNGYDADGLAAAIVGPATGVPHLMKIGVTYEDATVNPGAIPNE